MAKEICKCWTHSKSITKTFNTEHENTHKWNDKFSDDGLYKWSERPKQRKFMEMKIKKTKTNSTYSVKNIIIIILYIDKNI